MKLWAWGIKAELRMLGGLSCVPGIGILVSTIYYLLSTIYPIRCCNTDSKIFTRTI